MVKTCNHSNIEGHKSQVKRGISNPVSHLIKILKLGPETMIKRKKYKFRKGDIIDVEEFHDGKYGCPGGKRVPKVKPTEEQMKKVNALNKAKRCRQRLLAYFNPGDCFATWTYGLNSRPPDMAAALKDFQKAMRKIRKEYEKRGKEVFWIRNIERGTKGAWHIHLVINEIGDTASIIKKAWPHGGTYVSEIRHNDKIYDEDFTKLANYMTKNQNTVELKENGEAAKPRLKEANYNTSRNMPLPEPKVDKLYRWKEEPKPMKGYYIARIHEGINPITGFKYRRYTMIRLPEKKRKGVRMND